VRRDLHHAALWLDLSKLSVFYFNKTRKIWVHLFLPHSFVLFSFFLAKLHKIYCSFGIVLAICLLLFQIDFVKRSSFYNKYGHHSAALLTQHDRRNRCVVLELFLVYFDRANTMNTAAKSTPPPKLGTIRIFLLLDVFATFISLSYFVELVQSKGAPHISNVLLHLKKLIIIKWNYINDDL
jgi:hypothetical protein